LIHPDSGPVSGEGFGGQAVASLQPLFLWLYSCRNHFSTMVGRRKTDQGKKERFIASFFPGSR
jgi:hypothetical protein